MLQYLTCLTIAATFCATAFAQESLHFPPKPGTGNGKRIVLVSGDEEYRSEETCPMLAKILSQRHGFDCTVLFAINPDGGYVDPAFPPLVDSPWVSCDQERLIKVVLYGLTGPMEVKAKKYDGQVPTMPPSHSSSPVRCSP